MIKFGHYANECKVKDTIKQLKITDEDKEKLVKILELRNSKSSENETMVSNTESKEFNYSDSQISSLENPELKSKYLKKLRKVISQEEPSPSTPQKKSLNTTLERFNKRKEVTLQDLHPEVEYDGVISTHLGENVKFEFLSKPELHNLKALQKNTVTKTVKVIENKTQIRQFGEKFKQEVCSEISNAFWHRKQHVKNVELERDAPRLVINYKPLNTVLEWIRYPIPNKRDLINRSGKSVIFSKLDMKSGFWQIQIHESDRYKIAFVTHLVIMSGISCLSVLKMRPSVEQHWKHLHKFMQIVKQNGLSNPPPLSPIHTEIVKQIKVHVKTLHCLDIPSVDSFKIVETDASNIGYGGILKQRVDFSQIEQIILFRSGKQWQTEEKINRKNKPVNPDPVDSVNPSHSEYSPHP
ncbi:Excinuclease ABC, C subunit [Prunus dulcis]|uniref:Excinuclease ABC, C subunit n=1 Tax=Prunus dulcis TaxID=3755 RepID=A0A4Y1QXG7_PRUDU|nr:Excinuclease ABC, C subunit [Prunus dulcis]